MPPILIQPMVSMVSILNPFEYNLNMAKIVINRANFYHNLNQIALKTGSIDKIAVVLKDNAYGHGLEIIAQLSATFGIQEAVVRNLTEANTIRKYFKHIVILGGHAHYDEVYSFVLNDMADIVRADVGARVELKVDTGMHRNGIAMEMLEYALEKIKERGLVLEGVMTHFRAADEIGSVLFWQQKRFEEVKKRVKKAGFLGVRFHSHNSATLLRNNHFDEDIARVGIAIYGYHECPRAFTILPLKPVMKLVASRVATRRLKQGERIGYGGDFEAPYDMVVSTYDVGYGDGWCRGESKRPYVSAEGLPILGRVSMDFISLESQKEEIILFDNAQNAAQAFGTISYEITTALLPTIERVVE